MWISQLHCLHSKPIYIYIYECLCYRYIGESHMSNMVMVEVEIPSGWIAIKNHPSLIRVCILLDMLTYLCI